LNGSLSMEEVQRHPVVIMQQHHIGTMFGRVLVGWSSKLQEYHIYAELHQRSYPTGISRPIRGIMNKNANYQRQYGHEDKIGEQILFISKDLNAVVDYANRELGLRLQVNEG
jgi:hypothetical protein